MVEATFEKTVFGQRRDFVQQLIDTRQALISRQPQCTETVAAIAALVALLDKIRPGWNSKQTSI